jgi:peptide/nickel transport system substrate-binding protein
MRNIRWQFLIAIGGMILVIGLLLGQSPDVDNATPLPVRGGSYSEALVGQIVRLNPVLDFFNQVDRDIDRLLFTGLVRFDTRGQPVPDLAESWAVSADATLYTFTLRSNALWHDGAPVTADDVIFTFSKLQDADFPGPADLHSLWQQINIVKLSDLTVQFQLPEPYAPFFDYVALGLLPDHLLRGVSAADLIDHPFNLEPIGTGPFRLDRFLAQDGEPSGVSLVAFDNFYGQAPYLERVEFRTYPSNQEAMDAYLAGAVQGISQLDTSTLATALQTPGLDVHATMLPRVSVVFLNLRHPEKAFFADKRIRQALLLATNRQWIVDQLLDGQGVLAAGPILPWSWAFAAELEPAPFDPGQAKRLLDAAGWVLPTGAAPGAAEYVRSKDEVPLAFELLHASDPLHTQAAQALQTNWAAVGVQVTLVPVDGEALRSEHLQPRDYQAALTDLNLSRYPDPDPYPFWHDSQIETGQNYGGFDDRNSSIWLEQARTTPDFGRRADLYASFQHRFQDQVPALLLYYPVHDLALSASIQGVSIGPMFDASDRFNGIAGWYLQARRGVGAESTTSP